MARSTQHLDNPIDLSAIPFEYYKFTDVFSKVKAKVFAPYCSYNFRINFEEDAQPLVGTIYSLSSTK